MGREIQSKDLEPCFSTFVVGVTPFRNHFRRFCVTITVPRPRAILMSQMYGVCVWVPWPFGAPHHVISKTSLLVHPPELILPLHG